jgi:hypothetical protein
MASDARRTKAERDADYERGVFINCPFDQGYRPLFDAIVFVVFVCGLIPRSALEIDDASQTRIDKIATLIGVCRWGIHDISRVELNEYGLPRFNMPFELGLFLGARRFGSAGQRRKSCLVLDTDPFRFQRFISDISGQDITPHNDDPGRVMTAVRNWLSNSLPPREPIFPGGTEVKRLFDRFQGDLPALCGELRIEIRELTFADYARIVSTWLRNSETSSG